MNETLLFILMSLGLLFVPGPTNTLMAIGGATLGLRRSFSLVLAELGGYFTAIHLIAFVLGPFVEGSHQVQVVLRLALASYLFWLAARLSRSQPNLIPQQTVTPVRVLMVTLLNPKAVIFALVVLPPLRGQWLTVLPRLGELAAMIMLASVSWLSLGAAIARGQIVRPHFIAFAGALLLACFAIVLLVGLLH